LVAAAAVAVLMATLLFGSAFAGLIAGAIFTLVVAMPLYAVARLSVSSAPDRHVAPPGIPLTVLIVVSLGILAIALSAPWDALEGFAVGFSLWALAGTIWLVKLGIAAVRDGVSSVRARWRRWLFPFVLGVFGFTLAVSGAPFMVRFELSRTALDDAASRARAGNLSPRSDAHLGLFSGHLSAIDPDGVSFYLGDTGSDAYYFVQLPEGTQPASTWRSTWTHLGGRWWLNVEVTSR
jgi:hypothetical protein